MSDMINIELTLIEWELNSDLKLPFPYLANYVNIFGVKREFNSNKVCNTGNTFSNTKHNFLNHRVDNVYHSLSAHYQQNH
jgi:hypothetical protein